MLVVAVALATSVAGCLSPTLPLPPPGQPEASAVDKDGYVTLKGGANPQAAVFAYNTRTGQGGIDTADDGGQYEIRLKAQLGDDIDLWQEDTGGRSPSIRITIKKLGCRLTWWNHEGWRGDRT